MLAAVLFTALSSLPGTAEACGGEAVTCHWVYDVEYELCNPDSPVDYGMCAKFIQYEECFYVTCTDLEVPSGESCQYDPACEAGSGGGGASCEDMGMTGNYPDCTVIPPPPVDLSCSVSPGSALTGQSVTWSASASGGSGGYSYSWSGTDSLSGSGSSVSKSYASPGTKSATITVTSGGQWNSKTCTVPVTEPMPTASLSVSPKSVAYGGSSTLTWSSTNASICTGTNFKTGNATSGSVTVSATQSTTYTVYCSNSSYTASASDTLTVGPPYPDLSIANGPVMSGTAGVAMTLTAPVSNIGNAATPGSFYNVLRVCDSGCTNYDQNANAQTTSLSAGATRDASFSHTISAPAGTYYYMICTDLPYYQVAESNENNNCTGWQTISLGANPDLTAAIGPAKTATTGQSSTFTGTTQNIGAGVSQAGFTDLFIFYLEDQVTWQGYQYTSANGAIGAGASVGKSVSYTFPSAGTYYYRLCANWQTQVPESNTGNNCSAFQSVVVSDPIAPPAPSISCTVSPTSVASGGSVTYQANPANGATGPYTWVASDGTNVGTGASATRVLTTPGTHGMNVRASNTSVSYCPDVSVNATWCTAGSGDLTITATPDRVREGTAVALSWSATGIAGQNATCSVTGPGVSWTSPVSASPSCSVAGSANPTITTQSTYTLTCGSQSKSVTVNVAPDITEF